MNTKRQVLDVVYQSFTYIGAFLAALFLGVIVFFIFQNGIRLLNVELLTSNYHSHHYNAKPTVIPDQVFDLDIDEPGVYISNKYGIALYDDEDRAGDTIIKVHSIHPDSPLLSMQDTNRSDVQRALDEEALINRVAYYDAPTSLSRHGAEQMINTIDGPTSIRDISFSTLGGGIRGSLVTTLYLIGITLLIAMPIGILTAIYLNEFAVQNRFTKTLRSFIETLTGVPSIVYGLIGITLFVPLTIFIGISTGPNLIAASLTLAIILLPVIIRTTEESLMTIPNAFRQASLALGANKTQTVFKVVLPNALPGILTATFLAIGRIIGESAALIFVLGTAIKDRVVISESSTPLAVHIWSMMTDEPANIALSSTIALIILIITLILNILIKITAHTLKKRGMNHG